MRAEFKEIPCIAVRNHCFTAESSLGNIRIRYIILYTYGTKLMSMYVSFPSSEYVYESEHGECHLTPNDLFTVYTELLEASDSWYDLGLSLGLSPEFLDQLKERHPDSAACLLDMLGTWLQDGQNRTWSSVVVALRSRGVGEYSLASRLERKYCQEGTVD